MKRGVVVSVFLFGLFFLIPVVFISVWGSSGSPGTQTTETASDQNEQQPLTRPAERSEQTIPVFRSETETVEQTGLEEYVAGVVASEMPASFDIEALKAQALTARTYAAKQIASPSEINLPDGALVTDTTMHQVYQNEEELKEEWGSDFEWKMEKVNKAVRATEGQVLTYEGKPITAAFFSTSNGHTENAEDYWQNSEPYLQSVESPWDTSSPRYSNEITIPVAEVEQALGISLSKGAAGTVLSHTESSRVEEMEFGGETFSGREIREKLELDSTDFTVSRQGNDMVFSTKGWGHGVGMSQYGADGMADEGKTYKEIVKHYYKGVEITGLS
ncbi:stage II sporulation protein D [Salibacterium halotolerans]|uniref:Stage II sporulation protein D n=1 Tax=Salibacterium halotolerans TaxID=1884432 RepID=A0A1I5X688_9BACI|nr:stage II sporulation protein D [Salibacterium halotolerans]SFQ27515.1 stage II sporulation protein D [Salibacterium halotolerans]